MNQIIDNLFNNQREEPKEITTIETDYYEYEKK